MKIIFNVKIILQPFLLAFYFIIGLSSPILHSQERADLLSLYEEALRNDSLLSSARFQNEATRELI